MEREFKSKIGWWYHFLIILIIGGCIVAFLSTNIGAMIGMLLIAALALHAMMNTYYRITTDGTLIAHCSIFPEKKIAIADIQALESTVMPMFSYALSMERIMIWIDDKPWMMVSPKEKQDFVKALRKINPNIVIKKDNLF
ncbi:PH domain-containing protein [Parabacteroides sp. PF5-9]|uniref:PH domain-containing protein n=1 Tax=Parabacteroides sp. PF5-9 TaxID=1742404 RepID=UPI002474B100|nr:PH domain-containing protein [Parabacteroides sp. PF5-9]MDH6358788.1 hypothetical protein [Parabacteroides sp. PF5-9]